MTATTPPERGAVAGADVGRSCPYCRFALKEGIAMVRCGVCAAPHHADCWDDNDGCAVVACAGGPEPATREVAAAAAPPSPPTAIQQPTGARRPPPPAAWQPPTAPPPAGGSSRNGPWLVAAAVVLGLAVAGSAATVVLTRDGDGGPTTQTVVTIDQSSSAGSPAETVEAEEDPRPTRPASSVDGALVADEQQRQQIEQMLYEHHQAIVEGDYQGAWDLLSGRKQQQNLREDGYAAWETAQSSLRPYLDPSGIHTSIQALDPASGIARVMVTGMSWSDPDAPCSEWSGITWVKHEGGRWRYDPGYSTTPERRRLWSPRYPELLGGQCAPR